MSLEQAPVSLEHGEIYGKLTVLEKLPRRGHGTKYRCGCVCGFKNVRATAKALMSGRVKECLRCADPKGLQARL